MPTKNRRVAAYLPKEIDNCLQAFISERSLNGDSPALIAILSEFFGVNQQVAHHSEPLVSKTEFEDTLRQLRSELLGELSSELKAVEARMTALESKIGSVQQVKDELLSELKRELPKEDQVPGQLQLIPDQPQVSGRLLGEPDSKLPSEPEGGLVPLSGQALSIRLGLHKQVAINNKNKWKHEPDKFTQWSKSKDPDGVGWEYREDSKLYHPILDNQ
jgi:hypothetical protein